MSELIKWFERRREARAIATIKEHLTLTTGIVENLVRAVTAAVDNNEEEMRNFIEKVAEGERRADELRRKVMDDVSKGELPPADREDLMHLIKRVDMVADWSRESTRILNAIPMEHVPNSIKAKIVEMAKGVKGCAISLHRCVSKMMTEPEEALEEADAVEREEEKVDDVYGEARALLGKEGILRTGVAVLVGQLFEAVEMIADSCEDACDQVRVIMVRR